MADHSDFSTRIASGILTFPATAFTAAGELDLPAMRAHVAYLASHRPQALVPAGAAGELFSLSVGEHAAVVRAAVENAGAVPVIAGVGGGLAIAVEMARNAEREGVAGVLLLPPYLVRSEQQGLADFVRAFCASVDLPVVVYNRDNGILRPDMLVQLAEQCENLVGVKDGTGDLDLVLEIRRRTDGRLVLINGAPTAEMLASQAFAIGVKSYSSAVYAFAPELAQAFYDAAVSGDDTRRDALLAGFYFPYVAIRRRRAGNAVAIVKAGLKVTGQSAGPVRPPLLDLRDEECAELAVLIEQGIAIANAGVAR